MSTDLTTDILTASEVDGFGYNDILNARNYGQMECAGDEQSV